MKIWDMATNLATEKEVEFFQQEGIYYQNRKLRDKIVEQLVLPKACMHAEYQCCRWHMAGHLGIKKTTERVLWRFYWPGAIVETARAVRRPLPNEWPWHH